MMTAKPNTKTDIRCPHCKKEIIGQTTLNLEMCKTREEVRRRPVFLDRTCHNRQCKRTYWVVSK